MDEVLSGYQPGQVVELNHLTRLIARENFIILSRRESNKSQAMKMLEQPAPGPKIEPGTSQCQPKLMSHSNTMFD
jgi:hypothetical protein